MSITKAMGVARKVPQKRRASDHYATPHSCTVALLREEYKFLSHHGVVWEPAVGKGPIKVILEAAGLKVVSSDIIDRGVEGVVLTNFYDFDQPLGGASAIITNPPFGSRAPERFIRHAYRMGITYVALFLKANYFNAQERLALFDFWPPCAVYPLTWRPDWTGDGNPTMDMSWYVWDLYRRGQVFRPLPYPTMITPDGNNYTLKLGD